MERREADAAARIARAGGRRGGGDGDQADRDQHRRRGTGGAGRSPRTSARARSGRTGRAVPLWPPDRRSTLPLVMPTPPPRRGTHRPAPRNPGTGRTRRRPATAAPPRPAPPPADARCTASISISHSLDRHFAFEQAREHRPGLADRVGGADMVEIGLAGSRSSLLGRPPRIQWTARKGGERRRRRSRVGRLAVVDEQHAVALGDPLHPVRQRADRSEAPPSMIVVADAERPRRPRRRRRRSAHCAVPAAPASATDP